MANTYIYKDMTGNTPSTKMTFSCWLKKSNPATDGRIFGAQSIACHAYWLSSGELRCDLAARDSSTSLGALKTNRVFRDINAWYHIVFALDTTLNTADDRLKIWVNGVQETSFASRSNPAQNVTTAYGDDGYYSVGARMSQQGSAGHYFDGLMSHVHYCDGYAYSASDFGSTDTTTGEWKINTSPSVTHGTNGFFLKMENSANMDLDSSTNNHSFTTAGTLTKTEDCPSNVFCTINQLSNKIAFSLANGNTTLNDNGSDDNDNGIAATMGVNSGKYYWEMKKGSGSGGVHAVITDDVDVRLGNRATNSPDSQLWGFQSNGTGAPLVSYIAGTFNSTSNPLQGWGANDIIGFALDMDNGKLYVSINGVFKGLDNNTSDPANATNPAITGIPTGGKFIIPYFEKRSADSPETMCNFGNGYFGTTAVSSAGTNASGNGIFEYDVPTGFTALSTKGLNL